MSLDRNGLRDALVTMMNAAQTHNWTKEQVADAMATAIDGYVRAGAVSDVVVTLADGSQLRQSNAASVR
jgi:hypothetical protein